MDCCQKISAIALLIASLLMFIIPLIVLIVKAVKNKLRPEKHGNAGFSMALIFSILLLGAIWVLRFAVDYFVGNICTNASNTPQLTVFEKMVASLFAAARTFSMEEEYAEYISGVKVLISRIAPSASWLSIVARIYASLLNLIAPIISGAIILEILASVFPKIRLTLSYLLIWRRKYFFSELNAESLSLAKSIYINEKSKKPILIFTDTYVDDEKEKEYELLLEAKKYGAICVRDDLAHVRKTKCGKRAYFLMDQNEFGNLQSLMGLAEDHNVKYIRDAYIYLFVQSDAYVQLEKQINKEFEEGKKKKLLKGGKKPTIMPVNAYRNLVQNLFVDVPLYEPLINKADRRKLSVTIFGNGIIGTEAFLNAYWFGQMIISRDDKGNPISECEMTINVVSKDSEDVFWSKIDYINPEIKGTVMLLESEIAVKENTLLCCDDKGNKTPPYCSVRYKQADVKIGGFLDGDSDKALEADYFIVALGSDADNISVADKLRRLVGKKHHEAKKNDERRAVITYAVFNAELADTLNNHRHYKCISAEKTDIYAYAFGSLRDVYSCDNVYMSKSKLLGEGTGTAYNNVKMGEIQASEHRTRASSEDRNYNHWSDLARAMHIKYKAFSAGLMEQSVFELSKKEHEDYAKGRCYLYKKLTSRDAAKRFGSDAFNKALADFERCREWLAWLEHRRWNAFARIMGYQNTADVKRNLELNGVNYKNMELKLHPCLVEAEKPSSSKPQYACDRLSSSGLFDELPDEFDVKKLKKEEMIALFVKKKNHLLQRQERQAAHKTDGYDRLDKLSFVWSVVATESAIKLIDKAIETLNTATDLTEEQLEELKKAWNGIGTCDFKKYDCCQYDYDDYLTDAELATLLKMKPAYVAKLCKNNKFDGAEYLTEDLAWHIPSRAVESYMKKRYRKLGADEKIAEGDIVLFGKRYRKK